MPIPDLSYVAVAEEDKEIIGTMNTHLQLHLDHFWINPKHKELLDWRKIWSLLEARAWQPGLRVYAAPTFEAGERMAEILGFHKPEFPVMMKDLPCPH